MGSVLGNGGNPELFRTQVLFNELSVDGFFGKFFPFGDLFQGNLPADVPDAPLQGPDPCFPGVPVDEGVQSGVGKGGVLAS